MSISEHRVGAPTRLTLSGRARDVSFRKETLVVDLEDGRQIVVPLAWFPRLLAAGPNARSNWELVGRGIGISWPDIDEDISVENLLSVDEELLMDRHALTGDEEQRRKAPNDVTREPQARGQLATGIKQPRVRLRMRDTRTGRFVAPSTPTPPTR